MARAARCRPEAATTCATLFAADAQRFEKLLALRTESAVRFLAPARRRTKRCALLLELAQARGPARADRRDVRRREDQRRPRTAPCCTSALRNRSDRPILVDGQDVMPEVRASLAKMRNFVEGVHGGRIHGATGKTFTDIVNIGIGGSDLGIVMATEALAKFRNRNLRLHCVSNIDGVQLADVLEKVDPARTLFVVCSKTFTHARDADQREARAAVDRRSAGRGRAGAAFRRCLHQRKAMDAFLIPPQNRFTMWDWVGGRYSVWSAVGLSVALALGMDQFELMLEGGHEMDEHFRTRAVREEPAGADGPASASGIATSSAWIRSRCCRTTSGCIASRRTCSSSRWSRTANARRSTAQPVDYDTGAVLWGEPGSNAQHSFFQLLHQGTARRRARLPRARECVEPVSAATEPCARELLRAGAGVCVWADGSSRCAPIWRPRVCPRAEIARLIPHKLHPGNRPSSIILFPRLGPKTLGRLIALYEHKVFTQSVIWGINAFDQWGVELGRSSRIRWRRRWRIPAKRLAESERR